MTLLQAGSQTRWTEQEELEEVFQVSNSMQSSNEREAAVGGDSCSSIVNVLCNSVPDALPILTPFIRAIGGPDEGGLDS